MADFTTLLRASPEDLVRILYSAKSPEGIGFVARIDHAAAHLGVSHTQLICGLGFNKFLPDLFDVVSVLGFSSTKLLIYRRDELFTHDIYKQLSIDNILDIYTHCLNEEIVLRDIVRLLPIRFSEIDNNVEALADSTVTMSFKMELHAVYSSHIATESFAKQRIVNSEAGRTPSKLRLEEIRLIIENKIIPAGNLFFSEELTPQEKLVLIESGEIQIAMIKNRMQNTAISPDERDMLEDHLR